MNLEMRQEHFMFCHSVSLYYRKKLISSINYLEFLAIRHSVIANRHIYLFSVNSSIHVHFFSANPPRHDIFVFTVHAFVNVIVYDIDIDSCDTTTPHEALPRISSYT